MVVAINYKIKGVIWIGLSQITLLVSNLLILKLLTSVMSILNFGYYALAISIVLFARQTIFDPFSIVVAKECASNCSNKKTLSLGFGAVKYADDKAKKIIIILIILLFGVNFFIINEIKLMLVIFFCLIYLVANSAQGIYVNILNSIGDRKSAAVFSMIDSIVKLMLVYLFTWYFEGSLNVVLASISTGAFFSLWGLRHFVTFKYNLDKDMEKEVQSFFKQYFVVCIPLIIPAVLNALKSSGDRWALAGLIGVDDLAAYTVLMQIGYLPVMLIAGVLQTYLGPYIYKICALSNGNYELNRFLNNFSISAVIFAFISIGGAGIMSDWIFEIVVGHEYNAYSIYLPVFAMAASFGAAAGLLQNVVIGFFNEKKSSKIMTISISLSIVIGFLLIYFYKFLGAVVALVLAGIIPVIIFSLVLKKKLKSTQ